MKEEEMKNEEETAIKEEMKANENRSEVKIKFLGAT